MIQLFVWETLLGKQIIMPLSVKVFVKHLLSTIVNWQL